MGLWWNRRSAVLIFSMCLVTVKLTMCSHLPQTKERWEFSNLVGQWQPRTTYWTLGSVLFTLLTRLCQCREATIKLWFTDRPEPCGEDPNKMVIKKHIITITDPLMDPLQFTHCAGRGVDNPKTLIIDTPQPDSCFKTICIPHPTATHLHRETLHLLPPGGPADLLNYRLLDQQVTEVAGQ